MIANHADLAIDRRTAPIDTEVVTRTGYPLQQETLGGGSCAITRTREENG